MVISTGMTLPACAAVAALYCLTKSMMLTAWGPSAVPTGGAGVACPAGSSILITAATLRRRRDGCCGGIGSSLLGVSLELLYLVEGELDRGLAAEDRHQHLELLLVGVDLGDRAGELGEGPGGDGHGVADLPLHPWPDLLDRLGLQDPGHLLLGQRRGLGARADEAGHAGGVAHHVPGVVVQVHADQQVAGEDLAGDDLALASLDLHDVFHGDDDLEDLLLHVHRGDPALEVGLDLVLVSRVGVDHVPVTQAEAGAAGLARGGVGAHDAPGRFGIHAAHLTEDGKDGLAEQGVHAEDDRRDEGDGYQHDQGVADHRAPVRPVHLAQLGGHLAAEGGQPAQPRLSLAALGGGLLGRLTLGDLLLAQLLQALPLVGGLLLASHRPLGFPVHGYGLLLAPDGAAGSCTSRPPESRLALARRLGHGSGRPGGTRTPNHRFWRPGLYQLSYWPRVCRSAPARPKSPTSIGRGVNTTQDEGRPVGAPIEHRPSSGNSLPARHRRGPRYLARTTAANGTPGRRPRRRGVPAPLRLPGVAERRRWRRARATRMAPSRAPAEPAATAATLGSATPTRRRPIAARTRSKVPLGGSASKPASIARAAPRRPNEAASAAQREQTSTWSARIWASSGVSSSARAGSSGRVSWQPVTTAAPRRSAKRCRGGGRSAPPPGHPPPPPAQP